MGLVALALVAATLGLLRPAPCCSVLERRPCCRRYAACFSAGPASGIRVPRPGSAPDDRQPATGSARSQQRRQAIRMRTQARQHQVPVRCVARLLGAAAPKRGAPRHADVGALQFKRDGEILGTPRVTYTAPTRPEARDTFRNAVNTALEHCRRWRSARVSAATAPAAPSPSVFDNRKSGSDRRRSHRSRRGDRGAGSAAAQATPSQDPGRGVARLLAAAAAVQARPGMQISVHMTF